ncbi:MAG: hypothetical protein IJN67_02970 [Oscillospiraceae bacterium]|nr:hypothetical protein [Oscillospiraceae bacterium]
MMNETNIKKMEELLANEEFAQKIVDAGSYEKAYQLFVEGGMDASHEEFIAYIEETRRIMVEKGLISEDGELSVDMLDKVSGGGVGKALLCWGLAGAAFYFGMPQAGALMVFVGIAAWKA